MPDQFQSFKVTNCDEDTPTVNDDRIALFQAVLYGNRH
jgi:hypothetical protein